MSAPSKSCDSKGADTVYIAKADLFSLSRLFDGAGRSALPRLLLFFDLRLRLLYTSQFWVDEDAAAVLANDDLLVHQHIQLALGRYLGKAASTGVTLYRDDAQSIVGILTYTLEGHEQTGLNLLLKYLGLLAQTVFLSLIL
jgi:hypothetical protein